MTVKRALGICVLSMPLVLFCIFFIDNPLALLCHAWFRHGRFSPPSVDLPDLLLPIVCAGTALAWLAFFGFRARGDGRRDLDFYALLGITMPLAFLVKTALKPLFGRISTRIWVAAPVPTPFHWFHGTDAYSGFPSGHMLVFTVVAAALQVHDSRHRGLYGLGLALLGAALVATDYHFLSDVLAGACLGWLLHACALALWRRRPV